MQQQDTELQDLTWRLADLPSKLLTHPDHTAVYINTMADTIQASNQPPNVKTAAIDCLTPFMTHQANPWKTFTENYAVYATTAHRQRTTNNQTMTALVTNP